MKDSPVVGGGNGKYEEDNNNGADNYDHDCDDSTTATADTTKTTMMTVATTAVAQAITTMLNITETMEPASMPAIVPTVMMARKLNQRKKIPKLGKGVRSL